MPLQPLKIIKMNLRHSAAASDALSQLLLERSIDIALKQEPYVSSRYPVPKPIGLSAPDGYSAFRDLSSDHAYGALILVKSGLTATKSSAIFCNQATGLELSFGGQSLLLFSIYARPSANDINDPFVPLL